ncbi:hypothetical protein HGRIS_002536 [Hohenbuehelia grisea]|uniref:Uncharacterized protein n=1 Tax=Hohenbuehelia grisea TaxID=104357 RepID=A0ABR3JKR3_9AGAR
MNTGAAYKHESTFGPSSELVTIRDFIDAASHTMPSSSGSSRQFDDTIRADCSIDDIKSLLNDCWDSPRLSAYLLKEQEILINTLYNTVDKKRRKQMNMSDPAFAHRDVQALQNQLSNVPLSSYHLTLDSTIFMRAAKTSDQNTLDTVKRSAGTTDYMDADQPQAIIRFTVYNRITWNQAYVSRASQHSILSSQTLGDLFDITICPSNDIPLETAEGEYSATEAMPNRGVLCIESLAYWAGDASPNYAE